MRFDDLSATCYLSVLFFWEHRCPASATLHLRASRSAFLLRRRLLRSRLLCPHFPLPRAARSRTPTTAWPSPKTIAGLRTGTIPLCAPGATPRTRTPAHSSTLYPRGPPSPV